MLVKSNRSGYPKEQLTDDFEDLLHNVDLCCLIFALKANFT